MDARQQALTRWVAETLETDRIELVMVSGDASFRRYFRLEHAGSTWIAMDAPPEQEDSHSFVAVAKHWRSNNIITPEIHAVDLGLGFLLLSDFGDDLLLSALQLGSPQVKAGERYYSRAMEVLLRIQKLDVNPDYILPDYSDALLHQEMELFRRWLLESKLNLTLSIHDNALLDKCFINLAESALAQPQVPVHRDFHARNLMLLEDDQLGVLDFQDAVRGPITYDLVSLLRDCYIVWPDLEVDSWCQQYYSMALSNGLIESDLAQFKCWFDRMGMQRHLKAAGIFARLSLRDGKHAYLNDIPRTVDYIVRVSARYHDMQEFGQWLERKVVPLLDALDSSQ